MFQVDDITVFQNEPYKKFIVGEIPKFRQGKFVQIVVLRETKSHAVFTTEGSTLDVEALQAGIVTKKSIDRILMYKRKQVAPERRTGRSLSRSYGYGPAQDIKDGGKLKVATGECEIMGKASGECAY
jgi:CRISPR-associated protein Csc2